MRKVNAYGPSLIVLATVAVVLFAGPTAVKRFTYAQDSVRILQASDRLNGDNVLEIINQTNRDIAMMVEPSVVYISTQRRVPGIGGNSIQLSSGSGWVYDEEGHIVTNEHVIRDADSIEVQLSTGEILPAEVTGFDRQTDVAVLKIASDRLHPAQRGYSDDVRQGDTVFAFGSPFDFRFSMSSGIVSGLGRSADLAIEYENFIQVDAAINPGNSGGPLTDIRGHVIGMNTAIATGRRGTTSNEGVFSGIGLAIPMTMIESSVDQLIEQGRVIKGVMGVNLELTDEINNTRLRDVGFDGQGVYVTHVVDDSPAKAAGLQEEDVIIEIDHQPIEQLNQLRAMVSSRSPGESIHVRVWRRDESPAVGATHDFQVVLTQRKTLNSVRIQTRDYLRRLGFRGLVDATARNTEQIGVDFRPGVLVTQVWPPRSRISDSVSTGSIIVAVNDTSVTTLDGLIDAIAESDIYQFSLDVIMPDGTRESILFSR